MDEFVIGVDIGTSYTKAVALSEDGEVIATYREPTPHVKANTSIDILLTVAWWNCVKDVVCGLLSAPRLQHMRIASICVSAIAPTLTVFDTANPDNAYAILYSSQTIVEDSNSLPQSDPRLTKRRIAILKDLAKKERFVSPCITDLVGYVNWRLTDTLTINGISLVEMGIAQGKVDYKMFSVFDNNTPKLVAASECIGEITPQCAKELGIESGSLICGGCSDTMSSIVGAGLTRASERMLYLGTFGSLLHLEEDVNSLLDATKWQNFPFQWLLSIPGLSLELEKLGKRWFSSATASSRMCMLDQTAMKAPPGANGVLFVMPRWKNGMTPVGKYELLPNRYGEMGDIRSQARAALEGIAYAALALGALSGPHIKASGGGARSRIWLNIISTVLGLKIHARHMTWEAKGAADIAARMAWKSTIKKGPYYVTQVHKKLENKIIKDNYYRAMEVYYEQNWF